MALQLDDWTFSQGTESVANLQTKLQNTLRGLDSLCTGLERLYYHFTDLKAARAISVSGFRRSPVGMAGPGVYFTTCSPAAPLGQGGPRWPEQAFRDAMLRKNFGDAWEEAGRQGKLDAVIVCKLTEQQVQEVPDRPEAKYVGDGVLLTLHEECYDTPFPQPSATYLGRRIVAAYALDRRISIEQLKAQLEAPLAALLEEHELFDQARTIIKPLLPTARPDGRCVLGRRRLHASWMRS